MMRTTFYCYRDGGDNMVARSYVVSDDNVVIRYCYMPRCTRPLRHRISRSQAAREMAVLLQLTTHVRVEDSDNDAA